LVAFELICFAFIVDELWGVGEINLMDFLKQCSLGLLCSLDTIVKFNQFNNKEWLILLPPIFKKCEDNK
jgi:hypothetical protein